MQAGLARGCATGAAVLPTEQGWQTVRFRDPQGLRWPPLFPSPSPFSLWCRHITLLPVLHLGALGPLGWWGVCTGHQPSRKAWERPALRSLVQNAWAAGASGIYSIICWGRGNARERGMDGDGCERERERGVGAGEEERGREWQADNLCVLTWKKTQPTWADPTWILNHTLSRTNSPSATVYFLWQGWDGEPKREEICMFLFPPCAQKACGCDYQQFWHVTLST